VEEDIQLKVFNFFFRCCFNPLRATFKIYLLEAPPLLVWIYYL